MSFEASMRARHNAASSLVKGFLDSATSLLGQPRMTYNFHQLLHLVDNYKDFGPLYEVCAFPHESNLGALRHMIHGTNVHVVDKEICNKFATYQCLAGKLSSCENSVVRLTGKSFDRNTLDKQAEEALKLYLDNIEESERMTIRVYKRGFIANGSLIHISELSTHETPRCDSFYLLPTGHVAEVLNLLEVIDVNRKLFLTVVNVIGLREITFPWVNQYDKSTVDLDYPQYFVKKPALGQRIEVLPIENLMEPVIVMRNTTCATQYMSTSFFMSKN